MFLLTIGLFGCQFSPSVIEGGWVERERSFSSEANGCDLEAAFLNMPLSTYDFGEFTDDTGLYLGGDGGNSYLQDESGYSWVLIPSGSTRTREIYGIFVRDLHQVHPSIVMSLFSCFISNIGTPKCCLMISPRVKVAPWDFTEVPGGCSSTKTPPTSTPA